MNDTQFTDIFSTFVLAQFFDYSTCFFDREAADAPAYACH